MAEKNNASFIKKLTYRKELRSIVRFFRLSGVFRKLYFLFMGPRGGIINLQVNGVKTKFYVKTPGELRILESMGGGGFGEQNVLKTLLSRASSKDVFYDIGGHVGLYSVFLAKCQKNSKVFVFEPESHNYQHLLDNLKLNDLTNVTTFNKALGESNGVAKLYLGEDGGNSSLLNTNLLHNNYQTVQLVEGDKFIKMENLPLPTMIKIDVEGYEYAVIKGLKQTLSSPTCKILCCEVHPTLLPKGINMDSVVSLLKSTGFKNVNVHSRDSEYHIIAHKGNYEV